MTRIRTLAGVLATLALAVGGAAGCSDSKQAGGQPNAQPPGASQPTGSGQASAPTDQSTAPTDQATVPDVKLGGDAYCKKMDADQKHFENVSDTPTADEKARMRKAFKDLADAAPAEISAAMHEVATFYGKLMDGEISPNDQEAGRQFAQAVLTVQQWIKKHCTGYDIDFEGPGTS